MKFIFSYLKDRKLGVCLFFLFCAVFLAVFLLYRLPAGAAAYPALLCAVLGAAVLAVDCRRAYQRRRRLQDLARLPSALMEPFPPAASGEEADYQRLIELLREEQRALEADSFRRMEEMEEYYTLWVHQIKTPIAALRLMLQGEDSPLARSALEELLRIEQYVEMALCYLRLDSSSTDYVFRELDLDSLVRQAVKKFSSQFIRRRIALHYAPLKAAVVSDEKWLQFVVEQVLSNSLKYTPPGGSVTIELTPPKTLCIRDTGVGIAPEDLPRVLERGFTGCNGRSDKKASGLGLYLCGQICRRLGHRISVNSSLGEGTAVYLQLEQKKTEAE